MDMYVLVSSDICIRERKNCEETGGICIAHRELGTVCKCPDGKSYGNTNGCKGKCKFNYQGLLQRCL